MSSKKRKSPKWRSIKVHADVYERLRAQQASIIRDGRDAWGFVAASAVSATASVTTLSAVIENALAAVARMKAAKIGGTDGQA